MKKNLSFLVIVLIAGFASFLACQKKVDQTRQGTAANTAGKSDATAATPIQIYGAWHAGNDI